MLLLLACIGAPSTPVDSGSTEPVIASLTAAQVGQGVDAMVAQTVWDPHALMDTYLDVLSHGDGRCPGSATQITDTAVYGCTAGSGWYYMGVAEYRMDRDGDASHRELGGDFLVQDPDGRLFEMGAGMVVDYAPDHVMAVFMGSVTDSAASDWTHDVSAILDATLTPPADTGVLVVDGGVTLGDQTLELDQATWDPAVCQGAVSGGLGWRGPELRWYLAELECGCGPLVFEGQDLGTVCVDLAPLASDLRQTLQDAR
jgi:hypothetical protein